MQQNCTYNAYFINGTANIMGVFLRILLSLKIIRYIIMQIRCIYYILTRIIFSGAIFQHNNMYCIGECCDYNNIKA